MINFTVNSNIINKLEKGDDKQSKIFTEKFTRQVGNMQDLLNFVRQGYSFCISDMAADPVTNFCYRTTQNFLSCQMVVVDIDNKDPITKKRVDDDKYISWEWLKNQYDVRTYSAFIYKTPNYTDDWNRMRVVFELPEKIINQQQVSELQRYFSKRLGGDLQTTSCVQAFFGSKDCDYEYYGNILNETIVENALVKEEAIRKEEYKYKFNKNTEYDVQARDIETILKHIPFLREDGEFELEYMDWMRVVSAVGNTLNQEEAIRVLNSWAGVNYEREHLNKLKVRMEKVSLGSLIYIAKEYGYTPNPSIYKTPNANGKRVKPSRQDIRKFLQDYAEWRSNSMTGQVEYKPYLKTDWTPVTDRTINTVLDDIDELTNFTVSVDTLNSIIDSENLSQEYHPIKDFFESLIWDNHDRFSDIANCLIPDETIQSNAENNKMFKHYTKEVIGLWFRCAYATGVLGVPNEIMIILQGKQGIGKTRFIKKLYPTSLDNSYFYTGKIDESKDTISRMGKKFFFVDDEMESMRKTDIAALKALLSQDRMTVREVYGKRDKTFKRTVSFLGSVNKDEFLKDEENRRFPVIAIKGVNFNLLNDIDINQVWAQAKFEYDNEIGIRWANDEIKQMIKQFNSGHYIESDLSHYITQYIFKPSDTELGLSEKSLTVTEIADHIIRAHYICTNGVIKLNAQTVSRYWVKQELDRMGFKQVNHSGTKKYKVKIMSIEDYKQKFSEDFGNGQSVNYSVFRALN